MQVILVEHSNIKMKTTKEKSDQVQKMMHLCYECDIEAKYGISLPCVLN